MILYLFKFEFEVEVGLQFRLGFGLSSRLPSLVLRLWSLVLRLLIRIDQQSTTDFPIDRSKFQVPSSEFWSPGVRSSRSESINPVRFGSVRLGWIVQAGRWSVATSLWSVISGRYIGTLVRSYLDISISRVSRNTCTCRCSIQPSNAPKHSQSATLPTHSQSTTLPKHSAKQHSTTLHNAPHRKVQKVKRKGKILPKDIEYKKN